MAGTSDAGLRRRVLALVRACRPDGAAHRSRVSSAFVRLTSACRALAAGAATAQSSPSSGRLAEEEDQAVWTALEQLDAIVTRADGAAAHKLPLMLAQTLAAGLTLTLPRAGRKRSRSATRGQSEEDADINRKPTPWATLLPSEHSSALGDLLLVLVLHHAALVRLDALVVAISDGTSGLSDAVRMVLGATPIELPGSWQRVLRPEGDARREERRGRRDSHAVVECIAAQLARLAFSTTSGEAEAEDQLHRQARAAVSVLDALCCLSPSLPLAQQTPSLRVVIDAVPSNRQTAAMSVDTTSDPAASFERESSQSIAFLCGVLVALLDREASASERGTQADGCGGVIDSVLRVLPPPAAIQVVRRFLTHDNAESVVASGVPSSALWSGGNSSAIRPFRGGVFQLVRRYSSADAEFASLALALAHDLAEDALLHGKSWLLGHALELAATVAMSPLVSPSCYKDWFHSHFRNDTTENLDHANANQDDVRCIKSSKGGTSGSCRLIHGKNHLQLVCLFLLEFDRRNTREGVDGTESAASHVIWTSAHVMAHLSVLKGFQGQQSAENALVIDFCAEARVCYTTLLSREQSSGGLSFVKRSPSAPDNTSSLVDKRRSVFSSEARAVVDENVAYYKKHRSLSPQLKQWKTFQYLKWKSDILPCCLDVAIDDTWTALGTSGDKGDVVDQIHFVFALARANMVPADDYARFLAKIQSWVDRTRLSIAQDMQLKRQRDVTSSLRRSIKRLRDLCQHATVVPDSSRKGLLSQCLTSVSEGIFAYLDSRAGLAEAGNAADDQSRSDRMLLLWESAFMEVLNAIGRDGLDEFFAFQVSLLVKFSKATTRWSSTGSEHSTFLGDLSSIALVHRPSTRADSTLSIEWTTCFAGVVACMLATSNHYSTPVVPANAFREFSVIASFIEARNWPRHAVIVEKALLSTCLLRALASFHTENLQGVYTACTSSFPALIVDFWAWMAYRVWRESSWMPSTEAAVFTDVNESHAQTERDASDWIYHGQRVLLRTHWLQAFQSRWSFVETAKNMLRFEFVCGSVLKDAFESTLHARGPTRSPASTLQLHREIVNTANPSEPLLLWCQWLINEIMSLASSQPQEDADDHSSKSDVQVERGTHDGLQAAILLLNDLVHRSQQHSTGQPNDVKCILMSQWLGLATQTLAAVDEGAVAPRQTMYQFSSDILDVLRDVETSRLPPLQPVDDHRLMELMRVTAVDLGQPQLSEHARRFLLRPLLELASQQPDPREWRAESVTELPIALLVEWGRFAAIDSKERCTEVQNRHLLAIIDWLHGTLSAMMAPTVDSPHILSGPSSLPSSIFETTAQVLQFLVHATGFVIGSGCNARTLVVDPVGSQTEGSARVRRMAEVALDACGSANSSLNGGLTRGGEALDSLVPWLFGQWRDHVTRSQPSGDPLLFQLFLLQLVASLCTQSSHASKALLEPLADNEGLRAVFIVLLASVASNSGQLNAIMDLHSALWVNTFPVVALVAISCTSGCKTMTLLPPRLPVFEETLGGTTAFRVRAGALVEEVLTYGADRHVDLLMASLKPRVVAQWPHLEALATRLTVLGLDDDMTK